MITWITNAWSRVLVYFAAWNRLLASQVQIRTLERELMFARHSAEDETLRARHFEAAYNAAPIGEADRLLRLAQELVAPPPDARPVNAWELRCWLDDYRQYLLARGQLHHETPQAPGKYTRSPNGQGWYRE